MSQIITESAERTIFRASGFEKFLNEEAITMNEDALDARSHLCQYADLSLFWIFRTDHIQPGLIHYLGSDGTAYVLMDDDDERAERCIEFLEEMGSPVFADVNEMDSYAAQLGGASE